MRCKPVATVFLAMFLMFAATQADAVGCLEPCPQGEMYSEAAEMCVTIESQAWS